MINVEAFITIAKDNDILLSDKDCSYLRSKSTYQNKINYEDVIKELVLLIQEKKENVDNDKLTQKQQQDNENTTGEFQKSETAFQWVIRQNNVGFINTCKNQGAINFFNLIKVKKQQNNRTTKKSWTQNENQQQPKIIDFHAKPITSGTERGEENEQIDITARHREGKTTIQEHEALHIDSGRFQEIVASLDKDVQSYIVSLGPEMQGVVQKILGHRQLKSKAAVIDWSKHMSAGSKKINLRKNIQNKLYIKSSLSSEKIQQQKERIRRYMKENKVDIMHLNAINGVFLDCDEERTGIITKKQLLLKIAEENLHFPIDFLFNLISDVQEDSNDMSEDAILKYENLKNIIEIYNNCPIFLKGDSNNSDLFKGNMDLNKDMHANYDRIDKIFRHIHARIEEKFKDFRHAFRSFDKDFGGSLDFKEFITGMEETGIKLKLGDYRLIFDAIDYDGKGEIGFYKFCLLNTDRKSDLEKLKLEHMKSIEQSGIQSSKSKASKKPPLPPLSVTGQSTDTSKDKLHLLFGDNIPKNKDINGFTREIQNVTPVQTYMQKRFLRSAHKEGFRTVTDLPEAHSFGRSYSRDHDMVALLTNSYSEDLKKVSIEELRNQLAQKKQMQSKPTQAQMMRDKVTRLKYMPLGRNYSSSGPRSASTKNSNKRHFLLQGSNNFNMSGRIMTPLQQQAHTPISKVIL